MANTSKERTQEPKVVTVHLDLPLHRDGKLLAVRWGITWDALIASALRGEIITVDALGVLHSPMSDEEFTKKRHAPAPPASSPTLPTPVAPLEDRIDSEFETVLEQLTVERKSDRK